MGSRAVGMNRWDNGFMGFLVHAPSGASYGTVARLGGHATCEYHNFLYYIYYYSIIRSSILLSTAYSYSPFLRE